MELAHREERSAGGSLSEFQYAEGSLGVLQLNFIAVNHLSKSFGSTIDMLRKKEGLLL